MNFDDMDLQAIEEDEEAREHFQNEAHKAFTAFEKGTVEYDEETGMVTISKELQADIVLTVAHLRHDLGALMNTLAALKFMVKKEVSEPSVPLQLIVHMADQLIGDPHDVQVHEIDMDEEIQN